MFYNNYLEKKRYSKGRPGLFVKVCHRYNKFRCGLNIQLIFRDFFCSVVTYKQIDITISKKLESHLKIQLAVFLLTIDGVIIGDNFRGCVVIDKIADSMSGDFDKSKIPYGGMILIF